MANVFIYGQLMYANGSFTGIHVPVFVKEFRLIRESAFYLKCLLKGYLIFLPLAMADFMVHKIGLNHRENPNFAPS